jgi:hypothetical protein
MAEENPGLRGNATGKKKRSTRYPKHLQIKFRKVDPADLAKGDVIYHYAWLRDMSETGIRIDSEVFIAIGQVLEVYVDDKVTGQSFFAMAEVVRSRKAVEFYELGLRVIVKETL